MKFCVLLFCLIIQLVSCQRKAKNPDTKAKSESQRDSSVMDFIDFPIDDLEGIRSTRNEGIYRNFDFNYRNGESTFILVPKIGSEKWYTEQKTKIADSNADVDALIEQKLNTQSFRALSKEFEIWIFHIPKEFLKATPKTDSPYAQLIPAKISLYQYDGATGQWKIADTFSIHNENDNKAAQGWQEDKIDSFVRGEIGSSSLARWTGLYLNTDDEKLTSYKDIKNRIGWYALKISSKEIIFCNDSRMESEFPTVAPGGYLIHHPCNYSISGDTIKLYEKGEDEDDISPPKIVSDNGLKPLLILSKKEDKYYASSSDIKEAESLVNAARKQSNSPYLFHRFSIDVK